MTSQNLNHINIRCKTRHEVTNLFGHGTHFFPGIFYTVRISAKKCCSRTNNLEISPLFKFGEEYYLLIIEIYNQNYWVGQNKLFGQPVLNT